MEGEIIFGVKKIDPESWPWWKRVLGDPALKSSDLHSNFIRLWGQSVPPAASEGNMGPNISKPPIPSDAYLPHFK